MFISSILSCQPKIEEETLKLSNWDKFSVSTKFQKIVLENNSDSIYFENWIYKPGVGEIPPKYELEKIETGKINLTTQEKESLIHHISNTITNPTYTDVFATNYVGNVEFTMERGNMKLMCQYNSVGDWTIVSNGTKKYTIF